MKHLIQLLFVLVSSLAFAAEDKLISYDQATSIITIDRSSQLKTYRVKPLTELTINGIKAPLDRLAPGMTVTITLADPQTVSRIAARGTVAEQFTGRSIVIKMSVDGSDIVRVRDGQLTIEHGEAKKPEAITVNGTDWSPTWNGNQTEPFKAFTPPLFPFGKSPIRFKQVSGRGKVRMDKMPQGDFEKILTIRFSDSASGADTYEVHVSW